MTKLKKRNRLLTKIGYLCLLVYLILALWSFYGRNTTRPNSDNRWSLLNPLVSVHVPAREEVRVEAKEPQTVSQIVEEQATRFSKTEPEKIKTIYLLHCLLRKESNYDQNKGHGDNGKAGGPLQFHNPTWERMRGQMKKAGLIEEIGSRYDMAQAIETTAWAISNGRGKEWGPILRNECF